MQTTAEETLITRKTRELCETIAAQPEFGAIRQRIDAFMADEAAKTQYQLVVEKGDALQQKQQFAMPLDNAEIAEFESARATLLASPVARDFLDAQQQMHQIQDSVMQLVTKTFEMGRVPAAEDLSGGDCGSGCGCAH